MIEKCSAKSFVAFVIFVVSIRPGGFDEYPID
jgi:hypothetical protein